MLFPSPGDLPNPGIKPESPALQVDSLPAEPPGKTVSYCMCDFFGNDENIIQLVVMDAEFHDILETSELHTVKGEV